MPRLIVSIDNAVVKEVALVKAHTTLGRRPYNDIVFDNLAVSGEHAVLIAEDDGVSIEDLGSTNGTRVNGEAVRRRLLKDADIITIGKYKVTFVAETQPTEPVTSAGSHALKLSDPGTAVIKASSGQEVRRRLCTTPIMIT